MTNSTWNELEAFIRHEVGIQKGKAIHPADLLENDLDLTGDDADEFMGKFFEHFQVEPRDYEFGRYFSEEGFNLFEVLLMPFRKKTRQKYDKAPLTVGMLEMALRAGHWDSRALATDYWKGNQAL